WTVYRRIESQCGEVGGSGICIFHKGGEPDVRILFVPVSQDAKIERLNNQPPHGQILIKKAIQEVGEFFRPGMKFTVTLSAAFYLNIVVHLIAGVAADMIFNGRDYVP